MDFINELYDLCETLERELKRVNQKLEKSSGELTGDDLSYIQKLTHSLKSIKTTIAMMEAEDGYSSDDGYDGGSYNRGTSNRGGSYARGRGRNAKRDSMGRYSSNDGGYSRHGEVSEEIKKDIQRLADKVE